MMNSIEKAGRATPINTIPASIGSANGASGPVKQSAARPSLTVTSGGANKAASLVERDSARGRQLDRLFSGEAPVPKRDWEGAVTGETTIHA